MAGRSPATGETSVRNFQKELAIQGRGAHIQSIVRVYFTIVGGRTCWY
jgi:hypothetical protein